MSTYEKIATIVIVILVVPMIFFSYHEFNESTGEKTAESGFNQTIGQDFKIGPFDTVSDQHASADMEDNCGPLQGVIIAALHDIRERLEHLNVYSADDVFGVNRSALDLFCHTDATITLSDAEGNRLILHKTPFTRGIPQGGTAEDIGTEVHIDATVVPAGKAAPTAPTTYGDVLIPDRHLDIATSSAL
jgi:hypothetical protein